MSEYDVREVQLAAQTAMVVRVTCRPDELEVRLQTHLPAIYRYVVEHGGEPTGMPLTRFLDRSEEYTAEVGLPVSVAIEGDGTIYTTQLPGGAAISADHFGSYERLGGAHEALLKWARSHGFDDPGGAWEVYETDPGQEPDPDRWLTRVYLPLGGD